MKQTKKHGSCPVIFAVTVTAMVRAAAAAAAGAVRTAGYQPHPSATESGTQDMECRNLFEVRWNVRRKKMMIWLVVGQGK